MSLPGRTTSSESRVPRYTPNLQSLRYLMDSPNDFNTDGGVDYTLEQSSAIDEELREWTTTLRAGARSQSTGKWSLRDQRVELTLASESQESLPVCLSIKSMSGDLDGVGSWANTRNEKILERQSRIDHSVSTPEHQTPHAILQQVSDLPVEPAVSIVETTLTEAAILKLPHLETVRKKCPEPPPEEDEQSLQSSESEGN